MSALAEPLRFWADTVLECIRRDHTNTWSQGDQRGPFRTARVLGMAMAALHDAHAKVLGAAPLVPGMPLFATGGTPAQATMAAASACRTVLVKRYPSLYVAIDAAWRDWLELHGMQAMVGGPFDGFGRTLGTAIEAIGVNDVADAAPNQYMPSHLPYTHDRAPNEPTQSFAGGAFGGATRLLANHVAGFPPPPARVSSAAVGPSPHYQLDFVYTAGKGLLDRHDPAGTRSLDEEITGIFWGYDAPQEIGTPPRLYMQLLLSILDDVGAGVLAPEVELRIAAACAIALADAGIDAWFYKYSADHMMWRPCLGIPYEPGGNGVAIPLWQPLGRPDTNGAGVALTPDFPSYPSGHATFGAAAFNLLRILLVEHGVATFDPDGLDDVAFVASSDEYDGRNLDPRTRKPRHRVPKDYPTLWKAITDNSVSRVYLGVHWQFDGVTKAGAAGSDGEFGVPLVPSELGRIGGVWLGCQIAKDIAASMGVAPATIAASRT